MGDRPVVQQWLAAARPLVKASRQGPHDAPISENTCGCGALNTPTSVGPLIRLRGYDDQTGEWRATVLYGTVSNTSGGSAEPSMEEARLVELPGLENGCATTASTATPTKGAVPLSCNPPLLHFRILPPGFPTAGGSPCDMVGDDHAERSAPSNVRPTPIATFGRLVFWRFDLTVTVLDSEAQWLEYWVEEGASGAVEDPGVQAMLGAANDTAASQNYSSAHHGQGARQKNHAAAEAADSPERASRVLHGDGGSCSGSRWVHAHRHVYIPRKDEGWRWAFYSCAGFSLDVPEEEQAEVFHSSFPLWSDLMSRHAARPFSALVGGGDQLYNDDVWQVPALKAWLELPDAGLEAPFSEDMATQVMSYYVHHYCKHFTAEGVREAYASIPQVNTWDDHDIFDGFGSYPPALQSCPVFRGLMECARMAYLLFQHHTTTSRTVSDGLLVTPAGGLHNIVVLGPHQALLLPDQRGERTRSQVISPKSYYSIFQELKMLPSTIRHLTLVATIPMVYPHITGADRLLEGLSSMHKAPIFRRIMDKTGLSAVLMNDFGEPELLDDLLDHWTTRQHEKERRSLIKRLQQLAGEKGCRVSIISGDVHLCGAGLLQSSPGDQPYERQKADERYMQQVISSAIVNKPPPTSLVWLLELAAHRGEVDANTHCCLSSTFHDLPGHGQLLNRRNWCEVEHVEQTNELLFTLRVESMSADGGSEGTEQGAPDATEAYGVHAYPIRVPPLDVSRVSICPPPIRPPPMGPHGASTSSVAPASQGGGGATGGLMGASSKRARALSNSNSTSDATFANTPTLPQGLLESTPERRMTTYEDTASDFPVMLWPEGMEEMAFKYYVDIALHHRVHLEQKVKRLQASLKIEEEIAKENGKRLSLLQEELQAAHSEMMSVEKTSRETQLKLEEVNRTKIDMKGRLEMLDLEAKQALANGSARRQEALEAAAQLRKTIQNLMTVHAERCAAQGELENARDARDKVCVECKNLQEEFVNYKSKLLENIRAAAERL